MTTTHTRTDIDPGKASTMCARFRAVTADAAQAFTNFTLTASLDDTMKNGLTNTHAQDDKGQEAPHGEA